MYDVLVVEDDDGVREIVVGLLELAGFTVCEAANIDAALAAIEQPGCCRVLITDIDLGAGADGFMVADRVREHKPEIPVLYMTGRPWLLEGRRTPRDHTLPKPFAFRTLVGMVREMMPA